MSRGLASSLTICTAVDVSPQAIARVIEKRTRTAPPVQALADITGCMVYTLALQFAEHMEPEEAELLPARWFVDGPERVSFLFVLWCRQQLEGGPLPECEPPEPEPGAGA